VFQAGGKHWALVHCPRYDYYYRSFGLWPAFGQ